MQSYDETKCPSIGETIACKPEVVDFKIGEQRVRMVLHGKRGRLGYVEEPVTSFEEFAGTDATGAEAWITWKNDCADDPVDLLAGLFMAMRRRQKA